MAQVKGLSIWKNMKWGAIDMLGEETNKHSNKKGRGGVCGVYGQ